MKSFLGLFPSENIERCSRFAVRTLSLITLALFLGHFSEAQTYTVIHNFTGGQDGSAPSAGLSMDRDGHLYGTAQDGGNMGGHCMFSNQYGCGAVYQLTRRGTNWILAALYDFAGGQDGSAPEARVIVGPDGSLFGTTTYGGGGSCSSSLYGPGCGIIFQLRPPARACGSTRCPWGESVLYSFDGAGSGTHGAYPTSEVVFDQAGNFYGTASLGGANGMGVVYKMTHAGSGWTYSVVYSFTGQPNDGNSPASGLIFDQAGNLYGTTAFGGHGYGTVFELSPSGSGWTETVLHSMSADGSEGYWPYGGLILGQSGNLYGTTSGGLSNNLGTAFELTPAGGTWTFSVLTDFPSSCSGSCSGSLASLTMDTARNLYGTTFNGGSSGFCGSAFKLTASANGYSYVSLYDFTCTSDGAWPQSNLLPDGRGNFYGTAAGEGATQHGVIFKITP